MEQFPALLNVPLFAYGSNLSIDQMNERNVRWDESRIEKAELENFRLIFTGKSERPEYKDGGLADLDAEPGSKALGVVYWTDGQLESLDRAEGVFKSYPNGCCQIQVTVRAGSRLIAAQTYVRKYKDPPNPPHDTYLRKIISGARAHSFPEEWVDQIKAYVDRLYSPRCQGRCAGPGCKCCRMHHTGSWNKVAAAFHRLAQYFRYERTFREGPSWSHEKLLAVYNVTPTLQYRVPPPMMNPVPQATAFCEWLLRHPDVQKQLYGWMIWLGQVFGLRYSEWVAAEWPMEGPRFNVDFAAGKVYVTGKGLLGGKTRSVTITPEREAGLRRLVTWRESLGAKLVSESVVVAPVLFPNLSPRHQRGRSRNPDVAAWNHTVRKYVHPYNKYCEESGHRELALDSKLVSSHKIGRPVHITSLALAKVDDKVAMEETGIEDERTLARYKRFSDSERREMIARTDHFGSGRRLVVGADPDETLRTLVLKLKQHAPPGKEDAWNTFLRGLLALVGVE